MSSTNRGGKRSPADYYSTPAWCVTRLMEALKLPAGEWLEPAAGTGAIIRAVPRRDVTWTAWELRGETRPDLSALIPSSRLNFGDFLAAQRHGHLEGRRYQVAMTNPPFSLAQDFIDASLAVSDTVVMLLRLNYLASKGRWEFMRTRTPDVYVLPNRPSFTGGGTDSIEYAWFVWRSTPSRVGQIRILGLRE